jgi:hypothetical protein
MRFDPGIAEVGCLSAHINYIQLYFLIPRRCEKIIHGILLDEIGRLVIIVIYVAEAID